LATVFIGCLLVVSSVHAQTLELRFLDVGQGDAALIVTPEGKRVLVDAGPGASPVVPYLLSHHYDTLDLIVASHNHSDHIGGMAAVITSTVVRAYLDNGIPHTTATYQSALRAVAASGAQYLQATARTITVGSARLRVLPPPSRQADQNNGSVGILLEYGEFRALLTGDSEQDELGYWLQHDSVPRVRVVKVAHHGSRNGTTAAWVQATRPRVAVISVGAGNSYGHPAPQVIEQWQRAGARVYRTDRDGAVIIEAQRDGSYIVLNEHSGPGRAAPMPAPAARPSDSGGEPRRTCCRVCTRGNACGNSCINRVYQCRQPPGCACDARP
jgi:beta-lactamase superfamily II metal-dependent hydrolase